MNNDLQSYPSSSEEIVAAAITHGGLLSLFQRSGRVAYDKYLWHCITGYLPIGESPISHVLCEIVEETGLSNSQLSLRKQVEFQIMGADAKEWVIHAFHFESASKSINLNWENEDSKWFDSRIDVSTVPWLKEVLTNLEIPMEFIVQPITNK